MSGPTNTHYIVAINADGSYPLTKESHTKDGQLSPEVQHGYLTTASVVPDGEIHPVVNLSLYLTGMTWADIQNLTWQQVYDRYLW